MRKNNFTHLIKEEMVKRFEVVVKEEIKSHNIAVEQSNRDISDLKNLFEDHKKLLALIETRNHEDMMSIKAGFEHAKEEILSLQKQGLQELGKKEKDIVCVLDAFHESILKCATKEELSQFKKILQDDIQTLVSRLEMKQESFEDEIRESIRKLCAKQESQHDDVDFKLKEFEKMICKFSEKLMLNTVDAEAIRRSQKVDEKTMYVMEKKIEYFHSEINKLKGEKP